MATVSEFIDAGDRQLREGNFASASSFYMALIAEGYQDEHILFNRAICENQLQHYEEAYIASNLALLINPNLPTIINIRAISAWKLGKFELAEIDFKLAISMGDEMADNNYGLFLESKLGRIIKRSQEFAQGANRCDISNIFFISSEHRRFENRDQVSHSQGCARAIRIVENVLFPENYDISIYSLDRPHPTWKSYLFMAPKRMKIVYETKWLTKLEGIGQDSSGESIKDYSVTINHPQSKEKITSIAIQMEDRNAFVKYC